MLHLTESDGQGKETGEEYSKRLTKAVEEMEKVNNKQKEVEKQKAELQEAVRTYYIIFGNKLYLVVLWK